MRNFLAHLRSRLSPAQPLPLFLFLFLLSTFLLPLTLPAQSPAGTAFVPAAITEDYTVLPDAQPSFAAGSVVLLHQYGGATIQTDGNLAGQLIDLGNAGRYALREVDRRVQDTFYFTQPLDAPFDAALSQVVVANPVPSLTVTDDLTAPAFDGERGGILLLVADDTLRIDATLSARAAGYAGGFGREVDSDCGSFTRADDLVYPLSSWRGSPRGASVAEFPAGSRTGRAPVASGGGGGNDHNSGGGGGANVSDGGFGGANLIPAFSLTCRGNFPGLGGRGLPRDSDRLYFGGGGGTGHANNSDQTFGGRGGGLIILSANHLLFSDNATLDAGGQSAPLADGDGAGGGGAAGTVLLHALTLSGSPSIILVGGNGGDVENNGERRCFGPGGGGAGGRLLLRGDTGNFTPVTNLAGGTGGRRLNSTLCAEDEDPAADGADGLQRQLGEAAVAAFSTSIRSGCSPLTVRFFNESGGDYTTARWSLPGSETPLATGDTVRAVYRTAGRFPVVLTLAGGFGPDTVATDTVEVFLTPTADFDFAVAGDSVRFTDASEGEVTSWFWDFGDGNSSTERDPVHRYDTSGNYQVSLTVVRGGCGNTAVRQLTGVIGTGLPTLTELGLRLYPNPATHWLRLEGRGTIRSVRGMDGRLLLRGNDRPTLSVTALPPGTYLVEVADGDGRRAVGRVVIAR